MLVLYLCHALQTLQGHCWGSITKDSCSGVQQTSATPTDPPSCGRGSI